jgi:hypothetical protein
VLDAIAEPLQTTGDALYGRSRDGEANEEPPVLAAIREDHRQLITEQRQATAEMACVEATAPAVRLVTCAVT